MHVWAKMTVLFHFILLLHSLVHSDGQSWRLLVCYVRKSLPIR